MQPPFFAGRVIAVSPDTAGGVDVNTNTQVLNVFGEVIPRLVRGGQHGRWLQGQGERRLRPGARLDLHLRSHRRPARSDAGTACVTTSMPPAESSPPARRRDPMRTRAGAGMSRRPSYRYVLMARSSGESCQERKRKTGECHDGRRFERMTTAGVNREMDRRTVVLDREPQLPLVLCAARAPWALRAVRRQWPIRGSKLPWMN